MTGQREKKYDSLMEKAGELFMKYGYNRVSVDQIALTAGISKMTLYKYFRSKEDLFTEVMRKQLEYHNLIIMEKINDNRHAIERIEALYSYMLQVAAEYPPILTRDVILHPSLTERIRALKTEMFERIWRYILEDGIKKGELRPMDVDFVCRLLMGLPLLFINTDYFQNEKSLSEFLEKFFDFMKYGMLGEAKGYKNKDMKEGTEDAGFRTHGGS